MWSRSKDATPPASNAALPPRPSFLNRPSASGLSSISAEGTHSKLKRTSYSGRTDDAHAVDELANGADDDTWGDQSDDEQAVAALAAEDLDEIRLSRIDSSNSSTSGGRDAGGRKAPAITIPLTSPSTAWSFNPFSTGVVSPKLANDGSPVLGVPRGMKPPQARSQSRKREDALEAKAKVEQREIEVEEVEDAGLEPSKPVRRGSSIQMDRWKAAIKLDVEELVKDPLSLLTRISLAAAARPKPLPPTNPRVSISIEPGSDDDDDDAAAGYVQLGALNLSSGAQQIVEFGKEEELEEDQGEKGREKRRRQKFLDCLGAEDVDLAELRKLAWAGIPSELRPIAWQLLLGYLPAPSSRRLPTLARKRQEYADAVRLAFSRGVKGLDGPIWHQISIDVPRTNPGIRLWQGAATQRSLERILYVWAIRHPASGYVQGINDLVTPFFQVFLSAYINSEAEDYDVQALPESVLEALEADSFWCLSKLLDGIQDNYIFAQPGIQRQVSRMKELCSRVDAPLASHLAEHNVEFIQFAFRWMNCLLMREMSVKNIVRMWDTYLAEGSDAFSEFHLYVCLAFLVKWSEPLRGMDFQSMIMFLQSLPTQDWTDKDTELLLSESFMWSRTFQYQS